MAHRKRGLLNDKRTPQVSDALTALLLEKKKRKGCARTYIHNLCSDVHARARIRVRADRLSMRKRSQTTLARLEIFITHTKVKCENIASGWFAFVCLVGHN